jgi:putative transposase
LLTWLFVRPNNNSYFVLYIVDSKYTANINSLFRKATEVTGKRPNTAISDGAPNFDDAFNKEFYTNSKPRTRHIRHVRSQGDHNNNKMEGMNGRVQDRVKVMRGLRKPNTPIPTGYQIYHDYLRPHEGLDNKTPAETWINIQGKNKWVTLIQNSVPTHG